MTDVLRVPLFAHIVKGLLIKRPNRFVVQCETEKGAVEAYLPNPGRLWELLFPGSTLYLVEKPPPSGRLRYMAVAVEREGVPVFLHTHLTNVVAAQLIEEQKIPGLEGAGIVRAEAKVGHSRFDFLLEREGRPLYLEVKSCSLFGRRIAMFPDAVTARGKRHIEELAALSREREGVRCGVLFLVHWPRSDFFLPDYHTDPEFAAALQKARDDIFIRALSLGWRADLTLAPDIRKLSIPWPVLERENRDRGGYLLLLHLAGETKINVGSLGNLSFPAGHYVYVGSAKKDLARRLARHLRIRKSLHWHIDYLRPYAARCTALPVRSSAPLEHDMAKALAGIAAWDVPSFGSSDCNCRSHLFGFREDPLHFKPFIDCLQHFRIDRLEKYLCLTGP